MGRSGSKVDPNASVGPSRYGQRMPRDGGTESYRVYSYCTIFGPTRVGLAISAATHSAVGLIGEFYFFDRQSGRDLMTPSP